MYDVICISNSGDEQKQNFLFSTEAWESPNFLRKKKLLDQKRTGLFSGRDLNPRESKQELFETSRVGSGRVGSGRVRSFSNSHRSGPVTGVPEPGRLHPPGLTRPLNGRTKKKPDKFCLYPPSFMRVVRAGFQQHDKYHNVPLRPVRVALTRFRKELLPGTIIRASGFILSPNYAAHIGRADSKKNHQFRLPFFVAPSLQSQNGRGVKVVKNCYCKCCRVRKKTNSTSSAAVVPLLSVGWSKTACHRCDWPLRQTAW